MEKKLSAALARRLAAYSATAGISLALAPAGVAQDASSDPEQLITGEVIYRQLDPAVELDIRDRRRDLYAMDFDEDGADDLELIAYGYIHPLSCGPLRGYYHQVGFCRPEGANSQNGVAGYTVEIYPFVASRLSSGAPIGSDLVFYRSAKAASMTFSGGTSFPFVGQNGYAGFRFVASDGALHYGWVRIAVSNNVQRARAFDFAYEAAPDTPIAAGDTGAHDPDVALAATVDRTTLPPEGGTLTFTVTLTNTTDEPEALDLWGVARRFDRYLLGVRRLAAFTLPAGATVTREVTAYVPADAPMGTGELKLHVGRYPRVIDSEAFTITKEGNAPADGPEGSFFVGDERFVEAEAQAEASAEVAATHALSAPRPNPTTGRAEVTLTVAEAQAVTVAVYDALGRRVALLHEGPLAAGQAHRLAFDGSGLPAGVYVVRAVGEAFTDTRVLTLTR